MGGFPTWLPWGRPGPLPTYPCFPRPCSGCLAPPLLSSPHWGSWALTLVPSVPRTLSQAQGLAVHREPYVQPGSASWTPKACNKPLSSISPGRSSTWAPISPPHCCSAPSCHVRGLHSASPGWTLALSSALCLDTAYRQLPLPHRSPPASPAVVQPGWLDRALAALGPAVPSDRVSRMILANSHQILSHLHPGPPACPPRSESLLCPPRLAHSALPPLSASSQGLPLLSCPCTQHLATLSPARPTRPQDLCTLRVLCL